MIRYPDINPVFFAFGPFQLGTMHIGPVTVYWYGIMYLIGFVAGWYLGRHRATLSHGLWRREEIADLLFYIVWGVILGGRLGYVLFYNFSYFLAHPLWLFKIHEGGMSFHGGLLGVMVSIWCYARKTGRTFFQVSDFVAPLVPIGLGAGRLGNFVNHELPGRLTDAPWGMVFPGDLLARHPSSIYEFFLEGVVLFFILWFFTKKTKPRFAPSGLFLVSYGVMRFVVEFFREPDAQLGFVAFNWMTRGQQLSIPMIFSGLFLLLLAYRRAQLKDSMNADDVAWLRKKPQGKE